MKKILSRNTILYILIFGFFFTILTLSPISGDDWGNYLVGKQGMIHSFVQAFEMYFNWEGRLVSRILINILTYHKWLWNIVNSLFITGIIYGIIVVVKPRQKKLTICLSILTVLLMNIFTFSQIIVWVAGNITYLFSFFLLFFYLLNILKNQQKESIIFKIMLVFINLILPIFVEHISVLLIMINISTLVIKYYQSKKWDKEYLIYTIISILSTLIMFLSPGTIYRQSIENTQFNHFNILEKIIYNIPNFIYYTFIINSFLLLLLTITIIFRIIRKKQNKAKSMIIILYMSIIPILTIFVYNLSQFIILPDVFIQMINPNNRFVQIYWLLYMIIYLFLLLEDMKSIKGKRNFIFTVLAFLANAIMLLSPTWGYRTSFVTYMFLIIPCIKEIDDIKVNKIIENIIIAITILTSILFLIFYINIRIEQNHLEESIQKQLEEDKQVIEIESFPSYANCNINPTNDYHMEIFKEYYQIAKEKEVILLPNHWRYIIIK